MRESNLENSSDHSGRDLTARRVVVTGGAGFIGSEVVRQLVQQKAHVTVLDNFSSGRHDYISDLEKVKVVRGDICDKDVVAEVLADQELVVHLAALPFIPDSFYHPEEFFGVNSMGTVNLLTQAIRSESVQRFVHISTSEVYGTAKYVPMDEEHPTLPHSTYAASKLAGDRAVFTIHKEQGFPTVVLRPFNSFGPNITQPYIVPEIAIQLLSNHNPIRLGNITSSRDLTYVSDTATAVVRALTARDAIGETINIGRGMSICIKDLAHKMAQILNRQVVLESDSSRFRPYDVDMLVCNNSKAARLLGWHPVISLEQGLKNTLAWISSFDIQFKSPFRGWPATYRREVSLQESQVTGSDS